MIARPDEIFNTRHLSDRELGQIEWGLNSPAYHGAFRPYLERMRDSYVALWKDPNQKLYDSDYLKCGVNIVEGLIAHFDKLLEETLDERVIRSRLESTPEQFYDQLRERGAFTQGASKLPASDGYAPDEDF